MKFPKLRTRDVYRETLDVFLGLGTGSRIDDGAFADMENLSSDHFPLLSPRKRRGTWLASGRVQGMIAKDALCYISGSKFVIGGNEVEMNLSLRESDCPKRLVSMGAYVIIFPDKKYINTANLTDFGNLEAEFVTALSSRLTMCDVDGNPCTPDYIQDTEPEQPENGALWMDTSMHPAVLVQWSAGMGMWASFGASYIKIQSPGIGAAFRQYDGVSISGLAGKAAEYNGSTVLWGVEPDAILIPGLLTQELTQQQAITVSRKLPEMDFVIESGNRLWGCRYGLNQQGSPVNEIYASKLGDFKNWSCFMGLSTDSYAASLGADGPFTGAISHQGYPLFFREGCIHKVYGNLPANYRIQTTECRGVQRGSEGSLAILGDTLYYKSVFGVCAYDGALPREIGLGQGLWHGAVAGAWGKKYYISLADDRGTYQLFVFDSLRLLWHREDSTRVKCFCPCREELYFLDDAGAIRTVNGTGEVEEPVHWMAQTGDLGLGSPDHKYLSKVTLRMHVPEGSVVRILVQYEGGDWETLGSVTGKGFGSVTLPLRLRRCDHLRLKLEGVGEMKLYSIAKSTELGSDVF